jgi:hypothetical protein
MCRTTAASTASRNELEQQLVALGKLKDSMPVHESYAAVEAIALEVARNYQTH